MTNVQVQRGLSFEEPLPGNLAYFSWSPDGARLLFIKHSPGDPPSGTLCLFELDGGRTQCLPEAGAIEAAGTADYIAWSSDGRQIRYVRCDPATGDSAILAYDLEQRTLTTLTGDELDLSGRLIVYFEPSPDDAFFLITHDTTCGPAGALQDPAVILYDRRDGSQLALPFDAGAMPAGALVWRPSR
jgi:Tol biopolymer transport system component